MLCSYFARGGVQSIEMSVPVCLSVCLSVCVSVFAYVRTLAYCISKTTCPNFTKYSARNTVAMARCSSGINAMCHALLVLWMTSCFHIIIMRMPTNGLCGFHSLARRRSLLSSIALFTMCHKTKVGLLFVYLSFWKTPDRTEQFTCSTL